MMLSKTLRSFLNVQRNINFRRCLPAVRLPKFDRNLRCYPVYLFDISRVVVEKELPLKSLEENEDFGKTCENIVKNVDKFKTDEKISMLQSLLTMGLSSDGGTVECLENALLAEAKFLPIYEVLRALKFLVFFQETKLQQELIKKLVNCLADQMTELKKDKTMLYGCWKMYPYNVYSTQFMDELEAATISYIQEHRDNAWKKFEVDGLLHLPVLLSSAGRRCLPLLHLIATELTEGNLKECKEPIYLINCLYSLNSLNFFDYNLLSSLTKSLCSPNFPKDVTPTGVSALLKALGQLKWKADSLMEILMNEFYCDQSELRWKEMVAFVVAAARLNFRPNSLESCLKSRILPRVTQSIVNDKWIWLDFVWSLAVLGCLDSSLVDSVLNKVYYDALSKVNETKRPFLQMKLLNIKAAADLMNHVVDLPKEIQHFIPPKKSADLAAFSQRIVDDISNFIPKGKYLAINLPSSIGTVLTACCVVNEEVKPLPFQPYESRNQPLPEGYSRVAILTHGFRDSILNANELIGIHNFTTQLLNEAGYVVVNINQQNFNQKLKEIQRASILRNLIKGSLPKS